jgi:hypothetical protein
MHFVSWYGASFLVISTVLCQGQSATPQKSPDSTSSQPTSNSKANASAAETSTSAVPQATSSEAHRFHMRLGAVTVGAGYGYQWGYPYYAFEPYTFNPHFNVYSAWLWGPFWSGYSLNDPGADKGQIRLTAAPKAAQVFLDGAYAGTADQLKSFWLAPGAYNLSVSTPAGESFHQRVYVLTGKSLKITAKLVAQAPTGVEAKP